MNVAHGWRIPLHSRKLQSSLTSMNGRSHCPLSLFHKHWWTKCRVVAPDTLGRLVYTLLRKPKALQSWRTSWWNRPYCSWSRLKGPKKLGFTPTTQWYMNATLNERERPSKKSVLYHNIWNTSEGRSTSKHFASIYQCMLTEGAVKPLTTEDSSKNNAKPTIKTVKNSQTPKDTKKPWLEKPDQTVHAKNSIQTQITQKLRWALTFLFMKSPSSSRNSSRPKYR